MIRELVDGLVEDYGWWPPLIAVGIPSLIGVVFYLLPMLSIAEHRQEVCREMTATLTPAERAANGITCIEEPATSRR